MFASSRKVRKTELSLFAVRQKEDEPLKEYLQRVNTAALEVPAVTQEVKASAFSQGLLDGDFFKSLAKKSVSKFDALLAQAAKYINMEEAQAAKKDSREEKRKEVREDAPFKKPRGDLRDRKPPFQRVNAVYTPLTIPITQAFMAVEEKGFITRPRSWRDTPQRPKSDKFYRFHNDYGHTMEECRHLKNEIERLIQNGYLQEYVCWEGRPYQKKEGDKAREIRAPSPGRPPREGVKQTSGGKEDNNDIPRKRVIRMIAGGPFGGDSHQARKSQVREAHQISIKEVLDIETMEDAPIIQFGRAERSGPQTTHNDALVITAMIANYEVRRTFIDSGSSTDILFGEAYDQMQLGDGSLEKVNTSLYGFAEKSCTHEAWGSGRSTRRSSPTRECYVEAVRKGEKRNVDEAPDQVPPSMKGKTPEEENSEEAEAPAKVQPAEELLNIEIIPENPDNTTRIGSHLGEEAKKEITLCLQRNADIFAWTPQDLEGIDPQVITHHLNIDPLQANKTKEKAFRA
ncbi:UNVERIFIED_CONTAM: hypothetical protein Slati_1907100 [Sesamum latifolium]|uniref:Reverse transcriptase domain-containing protein n=1 Tax=Sesamum latifolium TaxID=2727402 RepID=A0AAW2X0Q8_9LAMI